MIPWILTCLLLFCCGLLLVQDSRLRVRLRQQETRADSLEGYQEAMTAREQHFRILANNNSSLIWQTDRNGRTIFVNDTWRAYTGITRERTSLDDWTGNIHPDDREQAMNDFQNANQAHRPYTSKYRFNDARSGQYRWMLDQAQPVFNPDFDGYIGVLTDITDQEVARVALEELGKKKDEFFSVASHELKTPITTIKASLQIIERMLGQPGPAEQALPHIRRANKQVAKLSGIVTDLLDISRIRFGKLELKPSPLLMNQLVSELLEDFRLRRPDAEFCLEAGEEFEVTGDAARLEQVLLNLLDNAVKYSPKGGEITVRLEKDGEGLKCAVSDQGIGIPVDQQAQVFDRFFRIHENSRHYAGLGLGLFICAEIIRQHGGEIGVESAPGKGSTFWFTLPGVSQPG